ncbi:MAG: ABC transporter substrate-binding protein [Nevskia sp.]|nr:ABC transporter substrate-binding protein [Nevskia sp.]
MRAVRAVFAILCLVWAWASWAASATTPEAVVTGFHATLLDNMKHGKAYGCQGRSQRLAPVIDRDFDIPFIAQTVLRRHWDQLADDQRQRYTAAFRELVVATYAQQFADFAGERFTTQDTQNLPNGDALVHAQLKPGSGDTVSFDYVLRQKDGAWRIINIIADGVSDLALRSTQYAKLYEEKGFDGLLAWIEEQTRKARADCS